MAAFKRMLQVGIKVDNCPMRMVVSKYVLQGGIRSYSRLNGTHACLVDAYAVRRSLEAQGFTSRQSRAVAHALLKVLDNTLEKVDDSFSKRIELDKIKEVNHARLGKIMLEGQTAMDQFISEMDNKIKKHHDDIGVELKQMIVDMEQKMKIVEREHLTNLKDAKYDFIKYTVGTLISVASVSFAAVQFFK